MAFKSSYLQLVKHVKGHMGEVCLQGSLPESLSARTSKESLHACNPKATLPNSFVALNLTKEFCFLNITTENWKYLSFLKERKKY